MCGRFVSTSTPDRIAAYFGSEVPTEVAAESLGENYNVAPTQDVYAVVGGPDGTARVSTYHWGLVPSWAQDRKIASRMINARSETLADKPAFKGLSRKKRCIVPMDGFYEWKAGAEGGPVNARGKPLKQPMLIRRTDGNPMAVAGLWTAWKDPDDPEGRFLHSVTVITTAADEFMAPVHDRMPAVVPPFLWAAWLDPTNDDIDTVSEVFEPGRHGPREMLAVSTDVNNVRNNRPDLLDPVELA